MSPIVLPGRPAPSSRPLLPKARLRLWALAFMASALGLTEVVSASDSSAPGDLFKYLTAFRPSNYADPFPDHEDGGSYAVFRIRRDPGQQAVLWSVVESSHPEAAMEAIRHTASDWVFGPFSEADPAELEGYVVRIKGTVAPAEFQRPEAIHQVAPDYPTHLRDAEVNGRAVFGLLILPDGTTQPNRAIEVTHPAFAIEGARALKQWRFSPARWAGKPAATLMRLPMIFTASEESAIPSVGGIPARPEDRERLAAGAKRQDPQLRLISEIPYPAEAWPAQRPESLSPGFILDSRGRVVQLQTGAESPWLENLAPILAEWRFSPGRIDDERVPWAFRIRFGHDDDRSMLKRALEGQRNEVIVDPLDHPKLLFEHPATWRRGPDAREGPRRAVVDLLVDPVGRVRATRLVETDDPEFARFARALAAFSVYDRDNWRGRRGPVWLRRVWSAE